MNSKMTTKAKLSTTEPLKKKGKTKKNKLSKQLEQEQNHRNGDHMDGYHCGGGWGRMGGKLHRIRSIIGWHKIDGERLRTVQETEKPKNLYVRPMDMN